MVERKETHLEQSAFSTHPDYTIAFEPARKRIRVVAGGETIVDSSNAMILHETRHVPVYYFPRREVRMDLMRRTEHRTYCPFKGEASYWSLDLPEQSVENVMWSYEDPFDEVGEIKDYVSFYRNRMGDWFIEAEAGDITAARLDVSADDPLLAWLLSKAWNAASGADLTVSLGEALLSCGIPVRRLSIGKWSLHPQTIGVNYVWQAETGSIEVIPAPHSALSTSLFLDSPFRPLFEGADMVRVDLTAEPLSMDRPILREFREMGMTDYAALPLLTSDGKVNGLSIVTDRAGGFTDAEIGRLRSIVHVLARLFEVHTQRDNLKSLLDTYLGSHTGERVMHGLIRRGDGELLHGVVWFSDLRQSTMLAEKLGYEAYLRLLNGFFEGVTDSVRAHRGEILRFIGDGVLAIFPVTDMACPVQAENAIERALAAAAEAQARLAQIDGDLPASSPLSAGIALHFGEFMYGNVGSEDRLDFTVIGSVINECARLAQLSGVLGEPIVLSEAFRSRSARPMKDLGRHDLKGVREPAAVFAPRAGSAGA